MLAGTNEPFHEIGGRDRARVLLEPEERLACHQKSCFSLSKPGPAARQQKDLTEANRGYRVLALD